jgi:hypothetical protein
MKRLCITLHNLIKNYLLCQIRISTLMLKNYEGSWNKLTDDEDGNAQMMAA